MSPRTSIVCLMLWQWLIELDNPSASAFRYDKTNTHHHRTHEKSCDDHDDSNPDSLSPTTVLAVQGTVAPHFFCQLEDDGCHSVRDQQKGILDDILQEYPSATLVSSNQNLVNMLFIELPNENASDLMERHQRRRPRQRAMRMVSSGIHTISPSLSYGVQGSDAADSLGATILHEDYCVTGKGTKVAILDTGIDYTHSSMGGPGTEEAFQIAHGANKYSRRNRERDGLFPTDVVYNGTDFVGQLFDWRNSDTMIPDDDPIDDAGHGTRVAAVVRSVAPDAQLLAVRVCALVVGGTFSSCPAAAILQGMEYALDPNGDGNMEDSVDLINLSLGGPVVSAYYDAVSQSVENAFALGILTVGAYGNHGNRPYFAGGFNNLPNVLAVGAVTHPYGDNPDRVATFSVRGPGEEHSLKPDLSAPGEALMLPAAGSGTEDSEARGTSFACPFVTGAAALVKQKCPDCSPLIVKALLMNNVDRNVAKSGNQTDELAPLTLSGAGSLRIRESLDASFVAFCVDAGDVQPSLSLGLIDAAEETVFERRIRVIRFDTDESSIELNVSTVFRDPEKGASGAVRVEFEQETLIIPPRCNEADGGEPHIFTVKFHIDASKAPDNFLDAGRDPDRLERNEFDGHILISKHCKSDVFGPLDTDEKEISVPFHMILRKASKIEPAVDFDLSTDCDSAEFNVSLTNFGAGTAQIDAFEVLLLDEDDEEGEFGTYGNMQDIRSIAYRIVPGVSRVSNACPIVLEFVITFWERPRHAIPTQIVIDFFRNERDDIPTHDFRTSFGGSQNLEYITTSIRNYLTGVSRCSRFGVDHTPGSSNMIVRLCGDEVGVFPFSRTSIVGFYVSTRNTRVDDTIPRTVIQIPTPTYSAMSHDIRPGKTLTDLTIQKQDSCSLASPLGVQLITNAFRNDRYGSATRDTENLYILQRGETLPPEITVDDLIFADATEFISPDCTKWPLSFCLGSPPTSQPTPFPAWAVVTDYPTITPHPTELESETNEPPTKTPTCSPLPIPRLQVPTLSPSINPSDTPSLEPSDLPSNDPTSSPSNEPTLFPSTTVSPTHTPSITTRPTEEGEAVDPSSGSTVIDPVFDQQTANGATISASTKKKVTFRWVPTLSLVVVVLFIRT